MMYFKGLYQRVGVNWENRVVEITIVPASLRSAPAPKVRVGLPSTQFDQRSPVVSTPTAKSLCAVVRVGFALRRQAQSLIGERLFRVVLNATL